MAANVIVLICWTVISPLKFVRMADEGTDLWGREFSSTGRCASGSLDSGDSVVYLVLLGLINISAVIFANVQAYSARNIHTEYSESRYIALIMLFLLQAWLTGLPVLALVYDSPQANYVVVSVLVFLTSMAILLLIFLPKIHYTYRVIEEHNAHERERLRHNNMSSDWDDSIARSEGLKAYRGDSISVFERQSQRVSFSSVDGLQTYLQRSSSVPNGSETYSLRSGSFRADERERNMERMASSGSRMARVIEEASKEISREESRDIDPAEDMNSSEHSQINSGDLEAPQDDTQTSGESTCDIINA